MTQRHITLMVTGGHVTPGIAVIEEVKARKLPWEIVFVGRDKAIEGSPFVSEEKRLVTAMNIKFFALDTGRLARSVSFYTIVSILKIPVGFFAALVYCLKEKPTMILSFGGYVGLPVTIAGWLLGIPVFIHEQTRVPGLANRIIAPMAVRIFTSFADTIAGLPHHKVLYTGLPLRASLFLKNPHIPFPVDLSLPLLYITGGSTGSVSINHLIYPCITKLTRQFSVIHQVGRLDLVEAQKVRDALPPSYQSRYHVMPYIEGTAYAWVLQHAAFVVGRSGANTVGELAALGKVSILIPLPWSGGGEQKKNAQFLADAGGAIVLDQRNLTSETLYSTIVDTMKSYKKFSQNAYMFSKTIPRDAASAIVDEIFRYLGHV